MSERSEGSAVWQCESGKMRVRRSGCVGAGVVVAGARVRVGARRGRWEVKGEGVYLVHGEGRRRLLQTHPPRGLLGRGYLLGGLSHTQSGVAGHDLSH